MTDCLHLSRATSWSGTGPSSSQQAIEDFASRLAAVSTEDSPMQLLMTVAVPTDEVVFGVVTSVSAQRVEHICQQAGIPAQRVTDAVRTHRCDNPHG